MGKKPVVNLRVFKGAKMSFDENGKPQNENQSVKLIHDTVEWANFLKNFRANAYVKAEVESVKIIDKVKKDGFLVDEVSDYDNVDAIKKEVAEAFNSVPQVKLTPEQQRIADLEAKIDALTGGSKKPVEKKEEKVEQNTEPQKKAEKPEETTKEDLVEEYTKLYGKKPFHGWDEKKLSEMIEAKK